MGQPPKPVYCIDSSTLMDFERTHPKDIFVGVWDDLGELIQDNRLFSHREVYEEIRQGSSGFLTDWAKEHRQIFVEHTPEQAALIGEIVDEFPALSGARKTSPYEADPWLIAMSICEGKSLTVVTEESARPQKRKIPAACDHFGVPWLNGHQLLRGEEWKYVRAR